MSDAIENPFGPVIPEIEVNPVNPSYPDIAVNPSPDGDGLNEEKSKHIPASEINRLRQERDSFFTRMHNHFRRN